MPLHALQVWEVKSLITRLVACIKIWPGLNHLPKVDTRSQKYSSVNLQVLPSSHQIVIDLSTRQCRYIEIALLNVGSHEEKSCPSSPYILKHILSMINRKKCQNKW